MQIKLSKILWFHIECNIYKIIVTKSTCIEINSFDPPPPALQPPSVKQVVD